MRSGDGWLVRCGSKRFSEGAGAKARGLAELQRLGFNVPPSWALTFEAHDAYRTDRDAALDRLRSELGNLPEYQTWAVRSSANVEDRSKASYAGQFTTVLRVEGLDGIIKAVEATWSSASSSLASVYADRSGDAPAAIRMGVLLQKMIDPVLSGVAFSCDPVTGRRKVVIESVTGSGERLVQQGENPLNPEEDELPEEAIAKVTKGTAAIASRLHTEVDIEWAYDGEKLWWLQLRPITTSTKVTVYSNRMSKEMLPGAIRPLVWSVNIPLINGAWIRIFRELTSRKDLDPYTLSRMFHYRVYFNMGEIGKIWESLGLPSDSLEQLMMEGMGKGMGMRITPKTAACIPRIALFGFEKLGWPGKTTRFIDRFEARCRSLMIDDLSAMTVSDLMERYDVVHQLNREAAYRNIITMLLTAMFTSALKRTLERRGESLESVDWNRHQKEQMECYPDAWLNRLSASYRDLAPESRDLVDRGDLSKAADAGLGQFGEEVKCFLDRFGHLSESGNDLTRPSWRERPEELMAIIRSHNSGRQSSDRKPLDQVGASGMGGLMLQGMAGRSSRYSVLKERMSASYALGYGLFRPLFMELGSRLEQQGSIGSRSDVFYLYLDELRKALADEAMDLRPLVNSRREDIARVSDLPLPETIYGDEPPPHVNSTAKVLKGLATSRGYYRGRTRVVRSISDFDRVRTGDVIVIPYSDVSWSSIFSRASAVISESGGVLSHSSILAREYGIPSVASVPNAMMLHDDIEVVVDGFRGRVYLDPGAAGR